MFTHSRWTWLTTVTIVLVITALPASLGFIGTDLGVAWEGARRLAIDGHMSLSQNFWNHKLPTLPAYLSIGHRLPDVIPNVLALRLLIFALCWTASLGFVLSCYKILQSNNRRTHHILALSVLVLCTGWLDWARNGTEMFVASALNGIAALLAFAALTATQPTMLTYVAGGVMGLAPWWRPTAISTIGTIAALLLTHQTSRRRLLEILGTTAAIQPVLFLAAWSAGFTAADFIEVMAFNSVYAGHYRQTSSIQAILAIDLLTTTYLVIGVVVIGMLLTKLRGVPLLFTSIFFVLEALLTAAQLKEQNFYLIGPLVGLTTAFTLLGSQLTYPRAVRLLITAFVIATAIKLGSSLRDVPTYVWTGSIANQTNAPTGKLAARLVERARGSSPQRLFVYGNRAHLYELAAERGILPYDRFAFANPIFSSFYFSSSEFDGWLSAFSASPPEYVITILTAAGPNIVYSSDDETRRRLESFDRLLREYFQPVSLDSENLGLQWPYGYGYQLHRLRE
jgi:hypothetical protein